MKELTLHDLREQKLILFECIAGSKAYGTDLPTSDTDIKGVFILPRAHYFSLNYQPQVNDKKNDIVFYEIGRFVELLSKNNPSAIELFHTDDEHILFKHPLLNTIRSSDILSKLCKDTFAGYALTQIKKAKGLNKKIFNPMPQERKSVLDFCFVATNKGSQALLTWLEENKISQTNCGLCVVPHIKDFYLLFHNPAIPYKGILKKEESNEVNVSPIPKGEQPLAHVYFNKEAYASHCKQYKQYWTWVEERNDERYQNTLTHGKNYDAKNMMHTFRLLDMAIEILRDGHVRVKRPNRDELLAIRKGVFSYQELIEQADEKIALLGDVFQHTDLPQNPNIQALETSLIQLREHYYSS